MYMQTQKQTDRHTDRLKERDRDKQTDRLKGRDRDKQTDRLKGRDRDKQTDKRTLYIVTYIHYIHSIIHT